MSLFCKLLISIALVTVVLSVSVFADNQTELENRDASPNKVQISHDILPFSDKVPPLPWLGHWLYGDFPEAEAVFFRDADERHAVWTQWRKAALDWEWEKGMQKSYAQKGMDTVDHAAPQIDFFKISAMKQRYAAYNSLLADSPTPDDEKELELLKAVTRFVEAVQNVSISLLDEDHLQGSSATHTIRTIFTKCFTHTIYDPHASRIKRLLSFIPSFLLFNTEILNKALHEQKKLQFILTDFYAKVPNSSANVEASPTKEEIKKRTTQLLQNINNSLLQDQNAVQGIYSLSLPLFSLALPLVNYERERVKGLLVNNDGANQAQQVKMKLLTKKLSRLKEWTQDLVASYSQIQKSERKGKSVKESKKPEKGPEQVLMVCLSLIAVYRLGCHAGLPAMEVLPSPSTGMLTRATGLVASDIPWRFYTIIRFVFLSGAVLYLLMAVKWWALKAALRSAPSYRGAHRERSIKNRIYRFLFLSLKIGEEWLPLLLPVFGYVIWKFNATISPTLLVECMCPSQRVMVSFLAWGILTISKKLCLGMHRLPSLIEKPSLHLSTKGKKY
ncbi:unnamed protein product [Phytomonas sp. Hart1]|nr:unnamed protein product [Phytomonas sp. Hart1]|eukprot:CCW67045.1 unnamed protein product [Phytomonas sp. isolate Hart1]